MTCSIPETSLSKQIYPEFSLYRCADKSLARPERKHATATKDFDVHIYPIYHHNWRNISTIYIYNKTSIKRNILTSKQNTSGSSTNIPPIMIINRIYETEILVAVACFLPGRAKDLSAPLYTSQYCKALSLFSTWHLWRTLTASFLVTADFIKKTLSYIHLDKGRDVTYDGN